MSLRSRFMVQGFSAENGINREPLNREPFTYEYKLSGQNLNYLEILKKDSSNSGLSL